MSGEPLRGPYRAPLKPGLRPGRLFKEECGAGLVQMFEWSCRQTPAAQPWANAQEVVNLATHAVLGVLYGLANARDEDARAECWAPAGGAERSAQLTYLEGRGMPPKEVAPAAITPPGPKASHSLSNRNPDSTPPPSGVTDARRSSSLGRISRSAWLPSRPLGSATYAASW